MHILTSSWRDGYLDYPLIEGHVRIHVLWWADLARLEDQFVTKPKNLRTFLNYLTSVGPRYLYRKVKSRWAERARNVRNYAFGMGVIIGEDQNVEAWETATGARSVAFIAPNHPKLVERVVLPEAFICDVDLPSVVRPGEVALVDLIDVLPIKSRLVHPCASGYSGEAFVESQLADLIRDLYSICAKKDFFREQLRYFPTGAEIRTRTDLPKHSRGAETQKPKGVLFGLGHYAKTILMPNVRKWIDIEKIHEVDPTQIGIVDHQRVSLDTAPYPAEDSDFDVYFAAGYHHTHAAIANYALSHGKFAVVEKPIATTPRQLDEMEALVAASGRFFACFHKRYAPYNKFARKDLGVSEGDPISYFALAQEIPVPKWHWYNWPNSGTRLLSNGCHWIDHFMFLNGYRKVIKRETTLTRIGDVHVLLELENGAVFNMLLTDYGSPRLGVRDYVELRAGDAAVQIEDSRRYKSEKGNAVVRRARFSKLGAYALMYREIAHRIATGAPGDSLDSLYSSRIVLELDAEVCSQRRCEDGNTAAPVANAML